MPSTQVDRNKRYQRKLRKMAEAGTLLYGIFAFHEDDFAPFLSPGEQEMINTIKTKLLSLENAVNMQKILETYLHSKAEWEDPANADREKQVLISAIGKAVEYIAKKEADAISSGRDTGSRLRENALDEIRDKPRRNLRKVSAEEKDAGEEAKQARAAELQDIKKAMEAKATEEGINPGNDTSQDE